MNCSNRKAHLAGVCFVVLCMLCIGLSQAYAFEPFKGDIASFDAMKPTYPTSGDTIKIGMLEPFSGSASFAGELYWLALSWVAHDVNSQGGIMVDGKKKKIQILKGDTQVKPAITKKAAERLALEDNVDILVGTSGTHLTIVCQQVAAKYKKIFVNYCSFSDLLVDDKHWNPYYFQTAPNTTQWSSALAYFYSARPERKFFLLCQDYAYGHAFAETFKLALAKYRPESTIVGEQFHPLFTKDFAPYLTKIQGLGAEVIISQDWGVDNENMVRQSRELGMKIPIASLYVDDLRPLEIIGGPAGAGLVVLGDHIPSVNTPANNKFNELWHAQWKKWEKPYNTNFYRWPSGFMGRCAISMYWLLDIVQRVGSTDAEKIIQEWEGDTYESPSGTLYMRPQDHLLLRNIHVSVLTYPNKWYPTSAGYTQAFPVPMQFCTPPIINGRK